MEFDMSKTPKARPFVFACLAGALGTLLAGCWMPGYRAGGQGASRDLYTYESRPDFPQNIVVVDPTTNEKILTVEIPIGQQLVIRFFDDYNKKNEARPALMRWKLMPMGTLFGELDNSTPVGDADHRRIDVYVRSNAEAVPRPSNTPPPEPVSPK